MARLPHLGREPVSADATGKPHREFRGPLAYSRGKKVALTLADVQRIVKGWFRGRKKREAYRRG